MKYIDPTILGKSLSYSEFRDYVTVALKQDPSLLQLSEDYLEYAILNQSRLNRLDKTLQIQEESQRQLQALSKNYIWLVITESWCGDAAQSVPMLNKLAQSCSKIDLRVVFRDQNLELIDAFLTNGGRAIPKVLVLDAKDNEVVGLWGPRPLKAQEFVDNYKKVHAGFDKAGATELQLWYTKDKGKQVEQELVLLMQDIDKA